MSTSYEIVEQNCMKMLWNEKEFTEKYKGVITKILF